MHLVVIYYEYITSVCTVLSAQLVILHNEHILPYHFLSNITLILAIHILAYLWFLRANFAIFCIKNKDLSFIVIAKLNDYMAIALQKNSLFKNDINKVLQKLKDNGKLEELKEKWLGL